MFKSDFYGNTVAKNTKVYKDARITQKICARQKSISMWGILNNDLTHSILYHEEFL